MLAIDAFQPTRSKTFDLIACDALRDRILYLETLPRWAAWRTGTVSHGDLEAFLRRLHDRGVTPWAIIFAMATVYPKQTRKVFPDILIPFDYFHIVQELFRWCRNTLLHFRKDLLAQRRKDQAAELWEHRWRLLKNMDRLSPREHAVVTHLIEWYRDTVVEAVLLFKDQDLLAQLLAPHPGDAVLAEWAVRVPGHASGPSRAAAVRQRSVLHPSLAPHGEGP